jgi:hypothetical protein
MNPSAPSVYPSKIDWWIAVLLVGTPLFMIGYGIYFTIAKSATGLFAVFTGIFVGVVMAIFSIPCRYTITDTSLLIKCGAFEDEIKLDSIRDAVPSSNPLSAPSLSLRRVKIVLDKGFRLVSPLNREDFIKELLRRKTARTKT